MGKRSLGKKRLSKKEKEILALMQMLQSLTFTLEEARSSNSIRFYGYVEKEYGISFVQLTRIDDITGDTYFKEFDGDLGIFSFLKAPDRFVFIGRRPDEEEFRPVHVAKINGQVMDLTQAVISGGWLQVPVMGTADRLRLLLQQQ